MPPRYAYWTILVEEQPTAFRAGDRDDLQPTFRRLKEKHPSARMVWFQNGTVWNSRLDAQEAMRERGERGRRGDSRQALSGRGPAASAGPRESKGAGDARQLGRRSFGEGGRDRREGKLEWKPKGAPTERTKLEWQPKGTLQAEAEGRVRRPVRRSEDREGGSAKRAGGSAKRAGGKPQAPRDKTWRPGGDHKDPRQKYKDAKKAKWTRFKQAIRKRWESKPPRKKKDGE